MSSLNIIAKGRIAYLLKRSRPKEFARKVPKEYKANLEILKQGSRQRSNISNSNSQRQEEEKKEESDEMNIDINPGSSGQRDSSNRQFRKYQHSRREDPS